MDQTSDAALAAGTTSADNPLRTWFQQHEGRQINKWVHYLDVYHRYFERYRGTDVHIVEIGVANGGSLEMWKDYFGPEARIFGVDLHDGHKDLEDEQTTILVGDQSDRSFLRELVRTVPRIDILLDDGGHSMEQQIVTFEEVYPHIEPDGLYVCEDTHTSYWQKYGGGYRKPGTFNELTKTFIDKLHAWHTPESAPPRIDGFVRSTRAMHWYDSIVVLEKAPMEHPIALKMGDITTRFGAEGGGATPGRIAQLRRQLRRTVAERAADVAARVRERRHG